MATREEELERKLQEKEKEFWERFWKNWDVLLADVKNNKTEIGNLKTEVKLLVLKMGMVIAAGIYAVEFLIKKYLH